MSEKVLGTIILYRVNKNNRGRLISDALHFTPDRTIVTEVDSGKNFQQSYYLLLVGMLVGGFLLYILTRVSLGFIGGAIIGGLWGLAMTRSMNRSIQKRMNEYSKLSPEEILKSNKNNYAIPNSDITQVELKKNFRAAKLSIQRNTQNAKIEWVGSSWKDVERI